MARLLYRMGTRDRDARHLPGARLQTAADRGTRRNLSATAACVPMERRAERIATLRTMRVRPGLMSQGARVGAALARHRPRPSVRVSPHSPKPNFASGDLRTPPEAGLCELRLPPGRPSVAARLSPRCRIARWRETQARESTAEMARLLAENAALRQRVTELSEPGRATEAAPLADGVGRPRLSPSGPIGGVYPNGVGGYRLCGAPLRASGNNAQRNRTGKSLTSSLVDVGTKRA